MIGITLTREQARRVYDRIGRLQDTQAFYEGPALELLIRYGEFEKAHHVLEFGCGTGHLACRLFSKHLPQDARYRALDISPGMVRLARQHLAPFADRAEVVLTEGAPPTMEPSRSADRFVSSYVLDLLPEEEITAVIREAHRILVPGGRLCLVSLSTGVGPLSCLVSRMWSRLQTWHPALVGGCRPIDLLAFVSTDRWDVLHHERVAPFGVPGEIMIAEPRR